MALIEVNKAVGPVLNYLVAVCEGYTHLDIWHTGAVTTTQPNRLTLTHQYATDWGQGGPIIDRKNICITNQHGCRGVAKWMASLYIPDNDCTMIMFGPTALVTAMCCYVASKLGEVVEVPDELLGDQPK